MRVIKCDKCDSEIEQKDWYQMSIWSMAENNDPTDEKKFDLCNRCVEELLANLKVR